MNDVVRVFALGGLDENGRNCYVVEINNDIFVLDCGTRLPDKTFPGVDYLAPNPDYLIKNKDRIKAYLITHGHDESMAALKYFYKKAPAPIYCSKETASFIKANAGINEYDVSYMDFHFVEPSSKNTIAGREVRFFQTCHNICYSSGIAINTSQGFVVYTGDYMIDFVGQNRAYHLDLSAIRDLKDSSVLLLMSESKMANKVGFCSPKHRTTKLIEKSFKDADKRIFVTCFWQNTYRIEEIMELCRKYNKKVYYYDDFTRASMTSAANIAPTLLHGVEIVEKENLLRVREKDLVILILGREIDLYKTIELLATHKNSDRRFNLGSGDLFINCGLPLPMLETTCTRAMDQVYRTGCKVKWLKKEQLIPMHAHEDDIKFFLAALRPKYFFPVRGNFVTMMANAKLALSMNLGYNHSNVFILDNGMQLEFDGVTRPRIIPSEVNKIDIAPLLIDGSGLSRNGTKVIEDRMQLGEDGVVIIAASVSVKDKKIIAGPDCQMRGFVYVKEAEPLLKSLSAIFVDEINTALKGDNFDCEKVYEIVKDRCKRFIKREKGRDPFIMPIIDIVN